MSLVSVVNLGINVGSAFPNFSKFPNFSLLTRPFYTASHTPPTPRAQTKKHYLSSASLGGLKRIRSKGFSPQLAGIPISAGIYAEQST